MHRARARRERGQTLIEGPALLSDAIEAGAAVRTAFALPGEGPKGSIAVNEKAMARLAGTRTPRGPVAVVDIPAPGEVGSRDVLVSVGVSDPGNLGTLVRTAAAFGMAFAYTPGSADPWSPKAIRSGAAGQFQTPVVAIDQPAELGCAQVATVVTGGIPPYDVDAEQVAILIGEEASGLPEDLVSNADFKVSVETPGPTESLNAAVAAGIVVYELARRKGNPQGRV
ncbi:MAG: RNA methyltransferase [Acidimicrobiia bacterium]|nr:RNA methyltransferase [Acidimicrobiia bacterium]